MNDKLSVGEILVVLMIIAICSAIVLTSVMKASNETKVEQQLIITNSK